jgi:hypothetical protein
MTGRARTDRTPQRARVLFLKELARRGNVSDAARKAGIGRVTVYDWRKAEPDFAAAWDEALETAIDTLESEAWRRAKEGTKKPIIGRVAKDEDGILTDAKGRPLYLREYSDSLMQTLLKAHRPTKYRERIQIDGLLQHLDVSVLPPDKLERLTQAKTVEDVLAVILGK